ncbi:hypothetical protein ACQW5G_02645 [Fructilactobacillus sp. Tb1]|uniref:hypothetical protein n=1 Tax=Fructilactobacillus sp. Tb1 TaxID=3422304 RepID=UPI003D2CA3DC
MDIKKDWNNLTAAEAKGIELALDNLMRALYSSIKENQVGNVDDPRVDLLRHIDASSDAYKEDVDKLLK